MVVQELINELKKYDPAMEVVTHDGYGSVDPIWEIMAKDVCPDDGDILNNEIGASEKMLVLGWNI
jgi:hypothetical protein